MADALDAIAATGFRHIELACQPHAQVALQGEAARQMRRQIEQSGLLPTTMHAPMGRNVPGAPDEPWRREVSDRLADFLRFAGELGVTGVVIHPVPNPRLLPDDDRDGCIDRIVPAARRSLDELAAVAEQSNVTILLENLPYRFTAPPTYPLLTMAALRQLIDDYPPQQVALVIDTGHSWTNRIDPATEIDAAGDRLAGMHLQDVDAEQPADQHWAPTLGGLDWTSITAALKRIDYRGTWTFEVITSRNDETAEQRAQLTRRVATQWGLE